MLLEAVKKERRHDIFHFYVGTSYRHCLIWENGEVVDLVQPHDVLGQKIGDKLPENEALRTMMKKSYDILVNHPINIERKKKGLNPGELLLVLGRRHKAGTLSVYGAHPQKGRDDFRSRSSEGNCGRHFHESHHSGRSERRSGYEL